MRKFKAWFRPNTNGRTSTYTSPAKNIREFLEPFHDQPMEQIVEIKELFE